MLRIQRKQTSRVIVFPVRVFTKICMVAPLQNQLINNGEIDNAQDFLLWAKIAAQSHKNLKTNYKYYLPFPIWRRTTRKRGISGGDVSVYEGFFFSAGRFCRGHILVFYERLTLRLTLVMRNAYVFLFVYVGQYLAIVYF